jgi:hypothetical protein
MKIHRSLLLAAAFVLLSNIASYMAGVFVSNKKAIPKINDLFYMVQASSEVFYYHEFTDVIREINSRNYEKAICMASESARHIFYALKECANDKSCRDYSGMSEKSPDLLQEDPPKLIDIKNCSRSLEESG